MAEIKQMSDVEIAFTILQNSRTPLYFRDLITKVLETKAAPVHFLAQAMAEIHTQINLDSRFAYLGKGMWGLSEWAPQRGVKEAPEASVPSTAHIRREKLLAEIQQQEYEAAATTRDE